MDLKKIEEDLLKEKAKIGDQENDSKEEKFGGDISSIMITPYDQQSYA